MSFQEDMRAFTTKRNEAAERMAALMKAASDDGRTLDAEEKKEYRGLKTEVSEIDEHIEFLKELIGEDATKTTEVKTNKGPTILVKKQDPDDKFPGQSFTRRVIVKALAHLEDYQRTPGQIAETLWGKTHPTLVRVIKAGVPAGTTTGNEWGDELVQADSRYMGDFIEYLYSMTVYDRLPLKEVPAHVTIKGQDGTATGYWTGEGTSIKVSSQDYSTISLTPLKVGAISVVTNELLRYSSPSAEMLVRDSLVNASSQRVDQTFLSTLAAVSGVSPAGLLVSGTPVVNSNGTSAAALRQDMRELYAGFITAKHATNLRLVMHPSLAKSISLMVNTLGQTEFPGLGAGGGTLLGDTVVTGENVNAQHMILLDPSEIWKIGDMGVEVSLSRDATIEQADDPTGEVLTPTAQSKQMTSMFQAESTAFKVVRTINYQKRRSSAVSYVPDAGYGDADATTA